ncbi:MAG: TonB-dependent receptor [Pseudomonadota bacterium]
MSKARSFYCLFLGIFAQNSIAAYAQDEAEPGEDQGTISQIEEIVVTAARRAERVEDVANSLQVFSGRQLERAGAAGFEDYVLQIPGISFRDQGSGSKRIAMRGVSNIAGTDIGPGSSVSTIGVYLNDVPLSGTSVLTDLAVYDVDRVEVLKGPQGTLYGEGAMGGAIILNLAKPNAEDYEFKSDLGLSVTRKGGMNYQLRSAVNAPLLSERAAIRFVGTYENNDGFIQNLKRNEDDANTTKKYHFRSTLGIDLSQSVNLELIGIVDSFKKGDFDLVDIRLGGLQIADAEDNRVDTKLYLISGTLSADLGFADVTSVTSYQKQNRDLLQQFDLTNVLLGLFGAPQAVEQPYDIGINIKTFAHESRIVSNWDKSINYIFGVFFRDKKQTSGLALGVGPTDAPVINNFFPTFPPVPATGVLATLDSEDNFKQIALYGELSYELVDGLEATVGARWFDERVSLAQNTVGTSIFRGVTGSFAGEVDESDVVLKASIAYKITPDAMVYATYSEGFRSGGLNSTFKIFQVGKPSFNSDDLKSYEVGLKSAWFDKRLIVNAAGFYNDWNDVQLNQFEISPVTGGSTGFQGNGGDGRILGFELSLTAQPSTNLSLGLNTGFTDSELTRSSADAIEGAVMPNTPKWTLSDFIQYDWPLESYNAYIRFEHQFSGSQATRLISATSNGAFVKGYNIGNIQGGLQGENWGLSLFIDNLWDERAQMGRGFALTTSFLTQNFVAISRPRTLGVRASFRY